MTKTTGSTGMNQQEIMRYLTNLSGNDLCAGIIESATRALISPCDIKTFYNGYVGIMRELGLAQIVADQNIGYVISKLGAKTAEKWFYILPQIQLRTSEAHYLQNASRISERVMRRRTSARERLPDDSVLPTLQRKRQEGLLRA